MDYVKIKMKKEKENNKTRAAFPKGFTLIEFMVVIGIIGVILVMGTVAFLGMSKSQRIRGAAMELAQNLRMAHERALSTGRTYYVYFPMVSNTRYYVIGDSLADPPPGMTHPTQGSVGGNIYFGCTVGTSAYPPEGYQAPATNNGIDFPQPPGSWAIQYGICTFNGRGGVERQGVVYLTDGTTNGNYAIGVSGVGRVKVYRFANGQWY